MSVGILAHLLGCMPYRELAAKAGESGFSHVQLALWKAISDIDFSGPGKLSPGLAMSIGEQFHKHGVSISVLGCYVNLFDRDKEQRSVNVRRFKELLRHARYFGAPVVAAETGKLAGGYTEQDWQALKETLLELTDEAEKWGVYVGLEAAEGHLIETAPQLAEVLDELSSSMTGVVIDPGNLLTKDNFDRQDDVIEEAFALLGNRIVAAHAKDRMPLADGSLGVTVAGEGRMNYELYMKLLNQYKPGVHIVMEEAAEHQMLSAKRFIEQIRAKV